MTAFSTYLRNAQLNWFRGTTFPAPPANFFIALYNGDPSRTGTAGTDVTTSIRTAGRVAIANSGWDAVADNGTARFIQNTASIAFGNSVAATTVTHVGIWDAAVGGNFIGRASSPFSSTAGAPVTIAAGALDIELS